MKFNNWLASFMAVAGVIFAWSVGAAEANFQTVPLQQFPQAAITNLSQLDAKKPIYIKMWATWCQPCMQQMPHFQKLYQQFGDKVNFVAVNIDINEEPKAVQKVIDQFGLTMPIWSDVEGKLAVELGLVGTPFSVLLNRQGEQVYSSHESDQALDGFLLRLAQGQQLPVAKTSVMSPAQRQQLLEPFMRGEQYVFVTATWCDWYLKESRPSMSLQCLKAQQQLNNVVASMPKAQWVGVVNNLWTDDKALIEFNSLYNMQIPFQIDEQGVFFQHYNVRQIPVLLKLVNGKIVQQVTDFDDVDKVKAQLSLAI